MIGKLQSNKVKVAVLFDYIHSLDSQKLADILSKSQKDINRMKLLYSSKYWNEPQKSGVPYNEVDDFIHIVQKKKLNIIGLMAIPPNEKNVERF